MKTFLKSTLHTWLLFGAFSINAQVPLLSSNPSAPPTIFLDFDGHTVDGTSWNYNGPIYCGASGLDAAKITEIFERVSEDYRPFNINVTTDSTKYLAAPSNRRIRVILTVTSSWYGSAGGVAFVNSFTWGDDTPCFIFTQLLNNNVKYISEAAAHEAGHTFGLRHQSTYNASCVKTSDYNYGQGIGEIGWAPIMGVGYYENLTLWHNGPNSNGCTSYQNDLDVIASATNGVTFRNDDFTDTYSTATNVSINNNQFTFNGIIEKTDDKDLVKFTLPAAAHFTLNAIPYNVGLNNAGSDLDMQVQLIDNTQNILGTYNPGNILGSVIDSSLNAGTYYLQIEGKGNIYAPDYGSLGSYSLMANTIPAAALPLRRLELKGIVNGDKYQFNWIIDADEQIVKQVLEISTDGRTFSVLTESANDVRSFSYVPYSTGSIKYRLNVTFINSKQYYSNVVSLRQNGSIPKPKIVGNLISNVITVNSPGAYIYMLYDLNGKLITQGEIINGINKIDVTNMRKGMHLIHFMNDDQNWIEKLVKQ